ncbi:MAG TPA: S9 family peptidase [Steroidobacteraceae bacterium]|jgi:dipeptidyl aminopeptidase/acylaminoacyl peptidase|nr:S9 family peptidase [Steroidobacteraceae bacterium]
MSAERLFLALTLVCIAAGANAAAAPGADAAQPFTIQDLVRMDRISDVAVAPDGKHVAYTQRTTDMEANKGRTSIWMLDTAKRGAVALRVTDGGPNCNSPEWSNDGRFIYFLSNRSGSNQVWRVNSNGTGPRGDTPVAAATQVTDLPLDVGSFRVSPKGDKILVSVEVFLDCKDLSCTKQRLDAAAHAPATGALYTGLFVRHWDTWSDGRRSQVFALGLSDAGVAQGSAVNLTGGIGDVPGKPFGGREDYDFNPDGTEVAFAVRGMAGEPWSTNFDVYEVAADGGSLPKNLTADNKATDGQPAFSPNGSQLAYLATDRPGFESDRFHLALLDLKSGVRRALTQNWDRSISSFAWSRDGKTLFATADHLGQRPVWAIDVASGRVSAITGAGEIEGFSVGTSKVFYTMSTLGGPANLYSVGFSGGKTTQWTKLNQSLMEQRKFGEYQQFSFPGWNGENVFGYVVKPADFKPDRKYPVAFLIHGGPQGSFGNAWSYRWNPQAFAGAGYAVVMIDFHGSTGYGQAFTDSISGDWGGKPLEDLKLGLDAALKANPWLDGDHMCALGGSYGGFMINWIAGQWPDGFKCLVSHDGIFDNRTMYYSTEELWFPEHEFSGPEYRNPATYAKFNPIDYVARWKAPMLVVHGQQDFRVPLSQGLSVFTALQRRGIPSELLYYPNENHWVLKPADSIEWYDTVLAWLNRWTRP